MPWKWFHRFIFISVVSWTEFFFTIFLRHIKIHGLYFLFRYFFCPTKYTFL
jgi:hypothetical protein